MVAITHPAGFAARRPARSVRLPEATYRRRRLAAVGAVLVLLALGSLAAQLLTGGASAPHPGPHPVARVSVVVEPGDTVWSIAAAVAPGRDPRPVVDAIVEANGGSAVVAGQRLEVVLP